MDENEHLEDEEMSTEDIVTNTEFVLNALIDLLVEKKVISEEELQKKLDEDEEE